MSSPVGVPDLLAHLRMGNAHKTLRAALDRASKELATGEKSDRFAASGGDTTRLDAIERSVRRIDARQPLVALAQNRAAAAQTALGTVAETVDTIGVDLMNSVETISQGSLDLVLKDARQALEQTISTLNTSFGGRYLFSGAATGTAPFKPADEILGALETAIDGAGPLDADGLKTFIAGFFDDNANFYEGSTQPSAPVELRDGVRLNYAVNVGDPADETNDALRATLRDLATVVVMRDVDAAALTDGEATRQALYKSAGGGLLQNVASLTALRSELGVAEQSIQRAQAVDTGERAALEQARASIMARDPYDAATEVAELEGQLQAIYTMTARSADLSLVNFLR